MMTIECFSTLTSLPFGRSFDALERRSVLASIIAEKSLRPRRICYSEAPEDGRVDPAQLKKIPLFANLTTDHLQKVGAIAAQKQLKANERVFQEGEVGTEMYIIASGKVRISRSEEHTSELQSPCNLVCRLLLEKKK